MNEILKDHMDYVLYEVQNKLRKANLSGALSGEESKHALVRACTKLVIEELYLTSEANEIFKNLKKII